MIRFFAICLFLGIFCLISLPLFLIETIIGKFDITKKERSSFVIVMTAFRIIWRLAGIDMTVIGKENVPEDVPVLYVGNHRSYFDIVTLYPLTKNTTGFVAKKELEKIPFISTWMRYMNCEFLDRDNLKEGLKSILNCIASIKSGHSVVIFPEGTRAMGDEMLEFKEGSFKIAEKSGCPIVPVAISNTDQIFEQHIPFVKKQKIVIEFGAPVYMKEMSREEKKQVAATVQSTIAKMLEKNKELTN